MDSFDKPKKPVVIQVYKYDDKCPNTEDGIHTYVQDTKGFQEGLNPHIFAIFKCQHCNDERKMSLRLDGYY